jgi:hypothetical protein
MIKFKAKTTINGKTVFDEENDSPISLAIYNAEREICNQLQLGIRPDQNTPEGSKNEVVLHLSWERTVNSNTKVIPGSKGEAVVHLSWECTMNRRAPARPKDVIAAEKAARAARRQEQAEWAGKREAERVKRLAQLRQRIQHQVDHAFSQGKHGTEPAAKYITCQHCDAPAAFLSLSAMPPRGVAVLDEDLIVGAQCSEHNFNYHGQQQAKIPCSRLEFFYDGVRQIAIKS